MSDDLNDQCEFLGSKFLAFAAAGVRPEPKGCPGKATLRPIDNPESRIKFIGHCMTPHTRRSKIKN